MSKEDYEHAIKRLLQAQRRPLSTKRIATKTHMTWPTAKKYLNQMKQTGTLSAYRSNNRIFWHPKKKKDW
jgi:Mn-dependent DtxR family transcriptional regulator